MYDMELNSFIWKFNQLLSCGLDAHLNLDNHAGSAWISLSVNLGKPTLAPTTSNLSKRRVSPSRIRRLERRAAVIQGRNRLDAAEEATSNSDESVENAVVTVQSNKVLADQDLIIERFSCR